MHQIGLHLTRLIKKQLGFGSSIAIQRLVPVNPIGICNCCQDVMGNVDVQEMSGSLIFVYIVMFKIRFDNSSVWNI
jgi:hypothetical protein